MCKMNEVTQAQQETGYVYYIHYSSQTPDPAFQLAFHVVKENKMVGLWGIFSFLPFSTHSDRAAQSSCILQKSVHFNK